MSWYYKVTAELASNVIQQVPMKYLLCLALNNNGFYFQLQV